jgi:hypothetical protein
VAGESDALEQVAEELYGLPPGEFTEARDALVKRLRADKERELANEVKALRKPTLAAWALNQLVRNRRKDVERLIAAGNKLRAAQEKLVSSGDRSGFQRAAAKERELVAQLASDAAALAAEAGAGSSQGLEEKLGATLHAAALDDETAAELAAGRVLRERKAVAGFGGIEMAPAPARPAPKRARPAKADKDEAARRKREQAEQAEQTKAREELSAARLEERKAGRERDAAAKAAARAAERLGKAEERAAEAARRLDEARQELEEAQERERAAVERHDGAAEAVEAAESRVS